MEGEDTKYAELVEAAREFLLLASNESPITIMSKFSTIPCPIIEEHGDSTLLPFVRHPFIGIDQVQQYFELRATHLRVDRLDVPFSSCACEKPLTNTENDDNLSDSSTLKKKQHHEDIKRIEDETDEYTANSWIVDTETNAISVVVSGLFTSLISSQKWESRICYRLALILEKRREVELAEWKVHRVDIWADAPTRL